MIRKSGVPFFGKPHIFLKDGRTLVWMSYVRSRNEAAMSFAKRRNR